MLSVALEGTTRLDSLGRRLRVATGKKMEELTELAYQKVIENLSGKVLQKRTGALAASIRKENHVEGDFYLGLVFPAPADAKAFALEKGGKGYYPIVATKASVLHFFMKSGTEVFAKSVDHPPSKEFAYLRLAAEEMEAIVPEGFREAIRVVLDGGDYY